MIIQTCFCLAAWCLCKTWAAVRSNKAVTNANMPEVGNTRGFIQLETYLILLPVPHTSHPPVWQQSTIDFTLNHTTSSNHNNRNILFFPLQLWLYLFKLIISYSTKMNRQWTMALEKCFYFYNTSMLDKMNPWIVCEKTILVLQKRTLLSGHRSLMNSFSEFEHVHFRLDDDT